MKFQVLGSGSKHLRVLLLIFVLTVPLVNPWIRGDGVGYYAYIHALLIHHDLNFETEWRAGNSYFTSGRLDAKGRMNPSQYTSTGRLPDPWAGGESMPCAPFPVP